MKINWTLILALVLSIFGLILILIFATSSSFNDWSWVLNPQLASQYGSFVSGVVGPIFTLVGFLLIYETIKRQRLTFERQQFETKFFELVKYHRENVELMSYKTPFSKEGKTVVSRQVFVEIKKQCLELYNDLKKNIDNEEKLSKEDYDKKILKALFLIVYFGVGLRTKDTLSTILKKYISKNPEELITILRDKKSKHSDKTVFYGGHQSKLGNYFRHLYHTVKFVDESNFLTDKEKESYIKILRAQLTTYEQAVLFFNSMCSLGDKWVTKKWITTYEFIKNMPPDFLNDIDFAKLIPMNYEYDEI